MVENQPTGLALGGLLQGSNCVSCLEHEQDFSWAISRKLNQRSYILQFMLVTGASETPEPLKVLFETNCGNSGNENISRWDCHRGDCWTFIAVGTQENFRVNSFEPWFNKQFRVGLRWCFEKTLSFLVLHFQGQEFALKGLPDSSNIVKRSLPNLSHGEKEYHVGISLRALEHGVEKDLWYEIVGQTDWKKWGCNDRKTRLFLDFIFLTKT